MEKKRSINEIPAKEIIILKVYFNNWFTVATTIQNQATATMDMVLDQSNWVPDEGRRAVHSWLDACQVGRDCFKKSS